MGVLAPKSSGFAGRGMRGTLKAQGRSLDRSTYINQKPNMAAPLGGVGGCKLCCGECPCLHPPPLPPKQRTLKTNFKIFGTNSKDPIISLVQGPKKSRTTFLIPPTKEEGGRCTLGLPFFGPRTSFLFLARICGLKLEWRFQEVKSGRRGGALY